MCGICGCDDPEMKHEHPHEHNATRIHLDEDLLADNAKYAQENRAFFIDKKLIALNIVASPGAGKTALLEATAKQLLPKNSMSVIVGDQATENDANRLKKQGVQALQIFTNKICHLDAHMISHAIEEIELTKPGILFIENVGNLICPALFDLGEQHRIVLLSVTEGEDKPLKYPYIFGTADLVILTKIDLLPYLQFDIELCIQNIRAVNPKAKILQLSVFNNQGLANWFAWLDSLKSTDYATA